MQTIATIGGGGQVGMELCRARWPTSLTNMSFDHDALDISDRSQVVTELANRSVALVINAAAYTAVDKAETDRERCWATNVEGVAHLAAVCADKRIPIIQISTDYVFDGMKQAPYVESDMVAPVNLYGHSKAAGEEVVRAATDQHIILRVACVYSAARRNFVRTILALADTTNPLKVVDDQFTCPTSAAAIANAIISIAEKAVGAGSTFPWGTYHFCGQPATSWYQFSCAILEASRGISGPTADVIPISVQNRPTVARRPRDPRLDCAKIARHFSISQPHWKTDLSQVVAEALTERGIT